MKKLSVAQFYDEEKKCFLNGRQVVGRCPIPGCTSDKAYADECSLGHQFLPSELLHPVSTLSGKKPLLKGVENWYFDLDNCIDMLKEYNDFLRKNTNTRKYQLETVEEFLKKPLIYVPRKYVENLGELSARLRSHKVIDEEKKNSIVFEFETLEGRDRAKEVLEELGIHYTSGKTLVPFRLSGNVEWGVPFPDCEGLKDLTFWVWPESLWAPISFTMAYLKEKESKVGENSIANEGEEAVCKGADSEICRATRQDAGRENEMERCKNPAERAATEVNWKAEVAKWWDDDEATVYQFIGEDNIYFYAIAQTGLFTGLALHLTHIIANRHLLYMDTKASSSSEIKPPMADELLEYYTKDQLRMHFMSLGLSSKSVGFKPRAFMKEEERTGVDMVLKEGNLITNVYNRLIRSCFYAVQNNYAGKIPKGEVAEEIKLLAERTVLEYERHMYNHEFHRISYLLDDFIRAVNKHWVNNVKLADANGDGELRKQIVVDCFYACKVMAILVHPIAPEGCEMFREYLNLGEELWNWEHILEPIFFYAGDLSEHELKVLEPRVDFFKKHESQLNE